MSKKEKRRKYVIQERRKLIQMKHPEEDTEPSKENSIKELNSIIVTAETDISDYEDVEDTSEELLGYNEMYPHFSSALKNRRYPGCSNLDLRKMTN